MALSMDDLTFRNSLLETGVLSTKEDNKWSFDLLIELLEGPLRNPKRLDEAMRASKFMKRLLGFFQPLSFRFSDARKDEVRRDEFPIFSACLTNIDPIRVPCRLRKSTLDWAVP